MKNYLLCLIALFLCAEGFGQIILKGTLYKKRRGSQSKRIIRDINLNSAMIYVIGDIQPIDGRILDTDKGTFEIRLPERYKPGTKVAMVVETRRYYRRTPFEHTISSNNRDNLKIKILLKDTNSERILITGKVKDIDTQKGIENVVVVSDEFRQPTRTDKYGNFRMRLLVDEDTNETTLWFEHPLYPNAKNVTITIPRKGTKRLKNIMYLQKKGSDGGSTQYSYLEKEMDQQLVILKGCLTRNPQLVDTVCQQTARNIIKIYEQMLALYKRYEKNPVPIYKEYQILIIELKKKL
jgi:hypothetical protein